MKCASSEGLIYAVVRNKTAAGNAVMHRFRLSLDVCRFAEGRAKYTHVSKVFQFRQRLSREISHGRINLKRGPWKSPILKAKCMAAEVHILNSHNLDSHCCCFDPESSKSVPMQPRNLFASRPVCSQWRRQQGPLRWILVWMWQLLQEHGLDPSFIGVKHEDEEVQDSASDFKTTAQKILRGKRRQMMLWPMLGPISVPEALLVCWQRHERSLLASCIVVAKTRHFDKKISTFHFQARHLQHSRILARVSFGCKNRESKNRDATLGLA